MERSVDGRCSTPSGGIWYYGIFIHNFYHVTDSLPSTHKLVLLYQTEQTSKTSFAIIWYDNEIIYSLHNTNM
jgi:hypothetical protein